jgi:hypothetical protein
MALNAPTLKALVQSKLASKGLAPTADGLKAWEAIAEAIVEHLTTAGVVNVVTTCPAGAGTGTGTVT